MISVHPMYKPYLSISPLNHYVPPENVVRSKAYQQMHTFHSYMKTKKDSSAACWIQNELRFCFAQLCVLKDQCNLFTSET